MPNAHKHIALMMGYYVHGIHHGVVRYARQAGWVLDATMATYGKVPQNWRGDGIICHHENRGDILEKVRRESVPTVDLCAFETPFGWPKVLNDNVAVGRMAGEHLAARGFQDIAYIDAGVPVIDRDRLAGVRAAAKAHGRRFHVIPRRDIMKALRKLPLPIGAAAQNDTHAIEFMRECLDAGYLIPQQVAVIGADNDELQCDLAPVPLSSVDSDVEGVGYLAASLLEKLMAGKAAPRAPILAPPRGVVERMSTNILAIPHVPAATALQFIRQHYREPITVDMAARRAGMCRRRLEDAFAQYVGRSMPKEILRLRLRDAQAMLRETDLKLNAVASSCGFSSASHMTRVFKRELGLTPRQAAATGGD